MQVPMHNPSNQCKRGIVVIVGDRHLMAELKLMWDMSQRHWMNSISIAYVMTDHHLRIIMMESKRIGDCDILVTEC